MKWLDKWIEKKYLAMPGNLAFNDSLTGAHNYNWLQYVADTKYEGQEVFVTVIDLNNFKKINDENGHLYGNQVLKNVYDQLLTLKQIDIHTHVCRYGGDEFIVLSKTNLTNFIEANNSNKMISFGTVKKDVDESMSSAFNRADDLMYKYKSTLKRRKDD